MAAKEKDSDQEKPKEKTELPKAPPTRKGKFFKNLFWLSTLGLVVLGGLAYISFTPQDLSDIEGYVDGPAPPPLVRNLGTVLNDALKEKAPVRITEEEINKYLRKTLKFEQEGAFKGRVTAKGVWVRLEPGVMEVIIEREFAGKSHTVSMLLRPEQTKQDDGTMNTTIHRKKGKWGKTYTLRGFMLLTNSAFESLGAAYSDEVSALRSMFRGMYQINVSEGVLELTPPDAQPAPTS